MKYHHNFNEKRARLERRFEKVLNALWAIDMIAAAAIFLSWMLTEFMYSPCPVGGICVAQLFTFLALYVALGVMAVMSVAMMIVWLVMKVMKVEAKIEAWKIIGTIVGCTVAYGLLYLYYRF